MDTLRAYIDRIFRDMVAQSALLIHIDDKILDDFLQDPSPSALFVVETEDAFIVKSTLDSPGAALALIKQGPLNMEIPLTRQIFPISIPSGDISESLHAVVHYVLAPYFEATANTGVATASANIASARQKIAELELSFYNLQFHTEIQLLVLPPAPMPEEGEEPDLNALQSTVNNWKKSIRSVVHVARDPSVGTASEEVLFWHSMENALVHIDRQVKEPKVTDVMALLEKGKRFHATLSFPGDTGLPETLAQVQKYNIVLRDLPLNDLLVASDINAISIAIDGIFAHITKKLRPSSYPVWRALALVEAISADFAKTIRELLIKANIFTLSFDAFKAVIAQVRALFVQWDDLVREFSNTARDVIRKRAEKFIPVRINGRHIPLKNRIDYLYEFRTHHEQLLTSLASVDKHLSDMQLITKLRAEFMRIATIDVLDTAPESVSHWEHLEASYSALATSVEMEVAKMLRSRLSDAQSSQEMFRIFADFNALFTRPAVRGAIHEYQTRLLEVVKADISELQSRVNEQYSHSFAFKSAALNDIPSISGLVIWLKQIRSRLDKLLERVGSILGSDWKSYAEGEKLYNECMEFYKKIDTQPVVNDWIKSVSSKQLSLAEPVFVVKRSQLSVNFDLELGTLFKELRALSALNYHVPHTFITTSQHSKQLYPLAIRLIEDLKVLYECLHKVDANSKSKTLVQKEFNAAYKLLIDGKNANWKSLVSIDNQSVFVQAVYQTISALEQRVEHTVKTTNEIDSYLLELSECLYSKEEFVKIIKKIQQSIDRVGVIPGSEFISATFLQVSQQLACRCIRELEKWTQNGKLYNHNLTLSNQVIITSPELGKTRESLFDEVNMIVSQIDCGVAILDEVWCQLRLSIESVNDMLEQASNHLDTWYGFQGLWDLKIDYVWNKLGKDLNNWEQVLEELHSSRKLLDDHEKKTFGRVEINFAQIHAYVNSKYDIWQDEMIQSFSKLVSERSVDFLGTIRSSRQAHEEISFMTGSIELLVRYLETVTNTENSMTELESQLKSLERAQKALSEHRFQFPKNWVYVDQIIGEWRSLHEIHVLRVTELENLRQRLISDTQSNITRLENKVDVLYTQWQSSKPVSGSIKPEDALFAVEKVDAEVSRSIKQRDLLQKCSNLFKMNFSFHPPLDDMSSEIKDFVSAWTAINKTWESIYHLESQNWGTVEARKTRTSLSQLLDQTQEMPSRIRQYVAFQHVQNVIRERIKSISTLAGLLSDAMHQRHWDIIMSKLGTPRRNLNSLTLGDVWAIGLLENQVLINDTIKNAEGERRIELSIQEINSFWAVFTVELISYQDKVRLIKNWDEIFGKADEHLQSLEAMHNSAHFKYFSQAASEWQTKLSKLRALFDKWVDVQRQWVYLESVFSTADIRSVLPTESAKFGTINSELFAIFKMVAKNPNVLEISSIPGINESMGRLSDLLSKLQKALGEYFERERRIFSRYYFVGDDDLLEMIGKFKVEQVEKHLAKMFAGVSRFIAADGVITGVCSAEDEKLFFKSPINQNSSVISILQAVESGMQSTLKTEINDAFTALDSVFSGGDIIQWYDRLSQAALVALRLHWTNRCEIQSNRTEYAQQLQKLLGSLVNETLEDISLLRRRRLESLITELVHLKSVVATPDLNWDIQLRYYLEPDQSITIKQAGATLKYGFEYQGAQPQLVRTPLIDRMFLTMTQALDQRYGGSPFGPAGTGKTESVKALGHALGVFVVVFCCDETFDFQAITRLLAGICQTGAWACFDEFNRLESNTLSSVSTHVSTIEQALRQHDEFVEFGARKAPLNPQTALFVTMNPEYIGRHKLPDNMKNLFRSFAMKNPDKAKIVEVLLYSQGFEHAKALGDLIVPFFNELATHTSSQMHYDWGLRALKNVLHICGTLKRELHAINYDGELGIIKLACNEIISPKLVKQDANVYKSLESVFERAQHLSLNLSDISLDNALGDYITAPQWIEKILQLHRFLDIHHGVMLVGATCTGKSSAWKTLARALPQEVEIYQMNPKTISKDVLYGTLDVTTREWSDGLFTGILRKITENLRGEDKKQHWIIFDGEIDPDWAENLNSVLDDNKILTLPSGERMPLPSNVKILFEVSSLATATPATVSRCGMIWFDQDLLEIESLVKFNSNTFVKRFEDENEKEAALLVLPLIEAVDFTRLHKVAESLEHIMDYSLPRALGSFWSLIESAIPKYGGNFDYLQKSVHLALVWAFAGDCNSQGRLNFCSLFEDITGKNDILEYDVSPISGQWIAWQDTVEDVDLEPQDVVDPNLVIPTLDTKRHEALIYRLLSVHQPLILCGPPGAGKTMTLLSSLRRSEAFDLIALNFSKTTTLDLIIRTLEQKCSYKSSPNGYIMEPNHMGQWIVLFCDEINLPAQDQYGTQKVISLLRELVERQGFYKGTRWVQMRRIQFVGACNPPTDVGRITMDDRFLRLCSLVYVDHPSGKSLHHIYESMCAGLLKCVPDLKGYADILSSAMISVYEKSQDHFQGKMAHYVYSPRELTRWCKGVYAAIRDHFSLNIDELARIWAYEALRLFSDRLATDVEREWTWDLIKSTSTLFQVSESALATPILFSDWLTKDYRSVDRLELVEFLGARMRVFNEEIMDKKLSLFDDMLDNTLRIDRVLRQPQGHMILMGASSSGKTTITKFVCWMNGISIYQIQSSNAYTEQDFVADLRMVLRRAGCEGLKTCFILDESNLWDSAFLEKMNTLLANSEVPGLFENEDYATLIADCKKGSSNQGLNLVDEEDLMAWFTRQISANLHVVFTINSPDNAIVSHTTTSPALFNRCVLSWMGSWSETAMNQVCVDQISGLDTGSVPKELIAMAVVCIHNTLEKRATKNRAFTPGELSAFITQFKKIFQQRRTALEDEQRHCNVGIEKLKGTMLEVKQLRSELATKQGELEKKDAESRAMLQHMLVDQSEAERKREAGIVIRQTLEEKNREIESQKKVIYADLELAEPAVLEAQRGVSNIKKSHLNELKSFLNPPEPIKLTLEAVCFVFGLKHGTWKEVLQAVKGEEFIPSIVNFDNEEQMRPRILMILRDKYLSRPDFTYEAVNRASKACGPLHQWITAQVAYATVLQKVEPLKREIIALEDEAMEKQAQETVINEMLDELSAKIEHYKVGYAELIAEAQSIKSEMKNVEEKLEASVHLVSNLESEKSRWVESVAAFQSRTETLVGNCLIAAGFIVYAGYFDQKIRKDILNEWQQRLGAMSIAHTDGLDVVAFMSNGEQRLEWKSHGLEMDTLNMENAIMLDTYYRFPFIIDPTNRTQEYLQKSCKLAITSFLDSSFKKHVESALRFGTNLLIRDAEHLDPVIMPLLNLDFAKRGGRTVVDFDGQEIDVGKDYKLFMITNDAEFQLMPHLSSRTTVINFTITSNSLERITLDETLFKSKPDLEAQRKELVNLQGEYQVQLLKLEVQLLSALNEAQGNILNNMDVISTLETIKSKAEDTKQKALTAKQAMIEIDSATSEYMPIAIQCSALYSLVDKLPSILQSYQFSLEYFLSIFKRVLSNADSMDVTSFTKKMYSAVYVSVSPALLQQDRVTFAIALLNLYDEQNSEVFNGDTSQLNQKIHETFGDIDMRSEDDWYQLIISSGPVLFTIRDLDPTLRLLAAASKANVKCKVVALGSQEGEAGAEAAINTAMRQGFWTIVQNLHMAPHWMNALSLKLQKFQGGAGAHKDCRIILTTQLDNPLVPSSILKACRLISVERPRGIKAGIKENISIIENRLRDPPAERTRIYLALAWTHAVIQERQRLGSVGWNQFYDFNDFDFTFAINIIENQFDKFKHRSHVDPDKLAWKDMCYLIVATAYGAKVDDSRDYDVIAQLFSHIFQAKLFDLKFELVPGIPETISPEILDNKELGSWIDTLPDSEPPTWLGLESSAQTIHLEQVTDEIRQKVQCLS